MFFYFLDYSVFCGWRGFHFIRKHCFYFVHNVVFKQDLNHNAGSQRRVQFSLICQYTCIRFFQNLYLKPSMSWHDEWCRLAWDHSYICTNTNTDCILNPFFKYLMRGKTVQSLRLGITSSVVNDICSGAISATFADVAQAYACICLLSMGSFVSSHHHSVQLEGKSCNA